MPPGDGRWPPIVFGGYLSRRRLRICYPMKYSLHPTFLGTSPPPSSKMPVVLKERPFFHKKHPVTLSAKSLATKNLTNASLYFAANPCLPLSLSSRNSSDFLGHHVCGSSSGFGGLPSFLPSLSFLSTFVFSYGHHRRSRRRSHAKTDHMYTHKEEKKSANSPPPLFLSSLP